MRSTCSRSFLALVVLAVACHDSSGSSGGPSFLAPGVNDLGFAAGSFAIEDGILAAHAFPPLSRVQLRVIDLRDGHETIVSDAHVSGSPVLSGGLVSYLAQEDVDPRDLNGDGDTVDLVLQILDPRKDTTVSVGLACAANYTHEGTLVAFAVSEASQEQDLDGDGELLSEIAFVYDAKLGTTTSLDLAVFPGATLVSGRRIVLSASEALDGDLNADGDTNDAVVFTYDADTGVLHDTERAVEEVRIDGSLLAMVVVESENGGRDLNHNGSTADVVGEFYDLTLSAHPLRVTNGSFCFLLALGGGLAVSFQDSPTAFGRVMAFDLTTLLLSPVDGLDVPVLVEPQALHDRRFTYLLDEDHLGSDLDGDGDRSDFVPFTFDARTGASFRARRAAASQPEIDGRRVAFLAPTAEDDPEAPTTIVVQDLRTGALRDLRILANDFRLEDDRIIADVVEAWGRDDLNGDGLFGTVLVVHDLRTGRTTNTRLPGVTLSGPNSMVALDSDVLVVFGERLRLLAIRLR